MGESSTITAVGIVTSWPLPTSAGYLGIYRGVERDPRVWRGSLLASAALRPRKLA
jgi:hypothetical protein